EVKIKAPRNGRPQHPAEPVRGIRATSPAQRCPFLSPNFFWARKRNRQTDLKGAEHLLVFILLYYTKCITEDVILNHYFKEVK
ncbi:MAG TPA: hypothetical protein PLA54_13840, partial [Spirochaetota bacterium]|nr:hypothetical protein [Spirochaetota bacterium]